MKWKLKMKQNKKWFLSMLLGNLENSLLGNLLSSERVTLAGDGVIRAGNGI